MNKFLKIVEQSSNKKYYKVKANIEFIIEAENDGQASYIIDSTLASFKDQSKFHVDDIQKISKFEYDKNLIIKK